MQTPLAQRFYNIKTQIGGNREKRGWEYTFGMPQESQHGITLPNKGIRRVLAQLEFALKLSESRNELTPHVTRAIEILEAALQADSTITNATNKAAEDALIPIGPAAKEYEILLIAHAHIDMNWMWGWQETVAATLSTFRTMLALMREYSTFTYSQSQASVYKIVEDYDPAMMDEIKQRIAEGRWECTTTAWVETDKNMPSTESLLRHIAYTRDYMRDTWGVDPAKLEIDFSPDTFGHSAFVPEINNYGNVKYYYHCRGHEDRNRILYRWMAPSGKEVLVHCEPYWYNAAIVPEMGIGALEFSQLCGGLKTGMFLYGVGNHGGGPTRRDIEAALDMQSWPVFPNVRFGTMHEYFKKAEAVRDRLPIWQDEINPMFTGCYTTQSRIKLGNRKGEAALVAAESLYAVSNLTTGYSYPQANFTRAWRNVLFTHFHDILTGSNVQESREHAMGLYADTMSVANTMRENATRAIAENIDTSMVQMDCDFALTQSEGGGVGYGISGFSGVPNPETGKGRVRVYTIFNPSLHTRRELVEVTLWDWVWDMSRLAVTDHAGVPLDFQKRDHSLQQYWDHKYIRLLVDAEVPALGYKTIVVKEAEMQSYPTFYDKYPRVEEVHGPVVLENDYLKATFHYQTGALFSLVDKKTGVEQICNGAGGSLVYVDAEKTGMSAWLIGRHLDHSPVTTLRITPDVGGELRKSLTLEQRVKSSRIKTTISLDRNATALAYSIEVNWEEYAGQGENIPMLIYNLPLASSPVAYQADTPAGYMRRTSKHQDVCGQTYGAAVFEDGRSLSIVCDCKYGYRGVDDALSVTLINSSDNPDPYPERGVHKINLWVAVGNSNPVQMKKTAENLCQPFSYVSTGSHGGKLPATGALLEMQAESSICSSAGLGADGSLIVRVYETCGKGDTVTLTLPFAPSSAAMVDLCGNRVGEAKVAGNTVSFAVGANCIAGVSVSCV